MEGLTTFLGVPVGTLGASGALIVIILMVVTGKGLRTEREFLDMKEQRDYYRDALEVHQRGRDKLRDAAIDSLTTAAQVEVEERTQMLSLLKALHDKVFS